MNRRADIAATRRMELVAKCQQQREAFATELQTLNPMLQSVETGMRIAGKVRRHPGWIAAAAVSLVLITPRRLASWMRAGTDSLRTWRKLEPQIRQLLGR